MTKKARLSALVGLLAFFFSAPLCFAAWPGECTLILWFKKNVRAYNGGSLYTTMVVNTSTGVVSFNGYGSVSAGAEVADYTLATYYFNGTSWVPQSQRGTTLPTSSALSGWSSLGAVQSNTLVFADYIAANNTTGCTPKPCDANDDDGDGVCNSCDKSAGAPDPKDCVYLTSRNAAGQVVDMMIDEGCKGSAGDNIASYRDEEAAAQGSGRLYYDLTAHDREMDSRTCNASTGADADGNCDCAYPPTNTKLAGFTDASGGAATLTDAAEAEFQAAKNLDDDDKLDDCASVKNRCEAACSTRGGVVTNTCSSESGSLTSSCTCANNELAYDLDNESSDDSDNSSADSDGDGVPDSIDPDSTGGPDSNADNVDDTAAAIKGAIASLGLGGKLDAVNGHLNSIGNSVSGLGSKIDGVGSAVSGLGSKIDGVGSSVDGLGSKLDGIGDKLDGISNKLSDGLEATGSADLPGTNEYNTDLENPEELSFVDTVHNFLNSSLPVLSSISGSGLTASGSPSMSTELWGKTITLDFADWQGVLRAAGLVLVAVATIFAFIIIL